MHEYKRTKFYNKAVRLSKKQRKNPAAVIREFYTWYHLDDLRNFLWEWMEAVVSSDCEQFESARDRSNLLFFYRNLELLAEAAYMMIRDELPEKMRKPQKKEKHSSE
jgi:hypothetical protein